MEPRPPAWGTWKLSLGFGLLLALVLGASLYARTRLTPGTSTLGYWHWQGQVSGAGAPRNGHTERTPLCLVLWPDDGLYEVLEACVCTGVAREL